MSARSTFLTVALAVAASGLLVGATDSSADVTATCLGEKATIVGTPGDDVITGTKRDDVIVALEGNDTIDARDGDDLVCAGDGNDVVDGGDGFVTGIDGGAGDDRIDGGDAAISLALYQDAPDPIAADLVAGTASGWGTDTLVNIDAVFGSEYDDVLKGDGHENGFFGGPGNDVISARGGDDFLSGDDGDDSLDGGPGRDVVSYYDSPHGIVLNLATGKASGWGSDRVAHIEYGDGSRFADLLKGTSRANIFEGEGGRDRLIGLGGSDELTGGGGRDFADGGRGRDECSAERKIRCP
jgi:Ca2+-binding RTX toxin-like protein